MYYICTTFSGAFCVQPEIASSPSTMGKTALSFWLPWPQDNNSDKNKTKAKIHIR